MTLQEFFRLHDHEKWSGDSSAFKNGAKCAIAGRNRNPYQKNKQFQAAWGRGHQTMTDFLFMGGLIDAREETSDTGDAGRASKMGGSCKGRKAQPSDVGEEGIGTSGSTDSNTGRFSGRIEETRSDNQKMDREVSKSYNLTGSDVARLAGITYQRLARIKKQGYLTGLYVVLRNPHRIRYQEEAVEAARTAYKIPTPQQLGGLKGGKARAENLTPDRRREIAQKGREAGERNKELRPEGFPLSGKELAKEAGADYQRVQRIKQCGLLDGLSTVTPNGRVFFKMEAVNVVKSAPRNRPGRPPGAKTKMNFTERARAAKAKAEERRKMLDDRKSAVVPRETARIPRRPDTPLSRVGCVSIGDKTFVLAATDQEEKTYYLFDESQTDMLGNRVARQVREGELPIEDVVQLIGTLFTTLESQFAAVDDVIIKHGKQNLTMVSELLEAGQVAFPDLSREDDPIRDDQE